MNFSVVPAAKLFFLRTLTREAGNDGSVEDVSHSQPVKKKIFLVDRPDIVVDDKDQGRCGQNSWQTGPSLVPVI